MRNFHSDAAHVYVRLCIRVKSKGIQGRFRRVSEEAAASGCTSPKGLQMVSFLCSYKNTYKISHTRITRNSEKSRLKRNIIFTTLILYQCIFGYIFENVTHDER